MSLTYDTATSVHKMGGPSERWLIEQLRSGRFPGRKVGRRWRMTDKDISDALDICGNNIRRVALNNRGHSPSFGLTPTSRKKMEDSDGPGPRRQLHR
jgi:hypothetical protein